MVRNAARALYIPPGSRDVHIERILRTIHDAIDPAGLPSHLDVLLDYARAEPAPSDDPRRHRRRHRSDRSASRAAASSRRPARGALLLRRRRGDDRSGAARTSAFTSSASAPDVPDFFRHNEALHDDLVATMRRRAEATRATLGRLGIAATRLTGESSVVPGDGRTARTAPPDAALTVSPRWMTARRRRSCPPTTTCSRRSPTAGCGWRFGVVAGLLAIVLVVWMLHAVPDAAARGAGRPAHGQGPVPGRGRRPATGATPTS